MHLTHVTGTYESCGLEVSDLFRWGAVVQGLCLAVAVHFVVGGGICKECFESELCEGHALCGYSYWLYRGGALWWGCPRGWEIYCVCIWGHVFDVCVILEGDLRGIHSGACGVCEVHGVDVVSVYLGLFRPGAAPHGWNHILSLGMSGGGGYLELGV